MCGYMYECICTFIYLYICMHDSRSLKDEKAENWDFRIVFMCSEGSGTRFLASYFRTLSEFPTMVLKQCLRNLSLRAPGSRDEQRSSCCPSGDILQASVLYPSCFQAGPPSLNGQSNHQIG